MNKLILIALLLPMSVIGQGNFFWSHNNETSIDIDMDFKARKTSSPDSTFNAIATDNSVYIDDGVNYWDYGYGTAIDPTNGDYSGDLPDDRIAFSGGTIEDRYHRLMSSIPYRSVWFEDGTENPKDGDEMTVEVNLFFDHSQNITIGLIGDNYFGVRRDGDILTESPFSTYAHDNFTYLNMIQVGVQSGSVNFSFTGQGDGTVDQTLGVIIWNNTKEELIGSSPVPQSEWDILWKTDDIVGETFAVCPSGYYYEDGNNECVKITDYTNWVSGDDLRVSLYVPTDNQPDVSSWTLKDGGGTTLASGTSYQEFVYISGLSSGSHTFVYTVTINSTDYTKERTITL